MTNFSFVSKQLLQEMFKRVGLTYTEEFCKQEGWYKLKSWTMAEQTDFQRWGEKVLKTKLKLTAYRAKREMSWFILNVGWTTRIDDEDKN